MSNARIKTQQNRRRTAYGFSDPDAFKEFNSEVQVFAKKKQRSLKAILKQKSIYHTGTLQRRTTARAYKLSGVVDRVGFKLLRYGVYVEKGVGKGRKINSGKTKPKPWFNPTIRPALTELSDIAQQHYADVVVRGVRIE
jgi:hypothetical protein